MDILVEPRGERTRIVVIPSQHWIEAAAQLGRSGARQCLYGRDGPEWPATVRAVTRGYQDAIADPLDAVALLKSVKPETDLSIENPGVKLLAPLWATDNGVFGWQEQDRWVGFASWMVESNRLSPATDATAAFDNSFVEGAR